MPSALFKYKNLYTGGITGVINRLYNIHPLFTACRTRCCKIFPVKLSAVLAPACRSQYGGMRPAFPPLLRLLAVPFQSCASTLLTSVPGFKHLQDIFILSSKPHWQTSPSGKLARLLQKKKKKPFEILTAL